MGDLLHRLGVDGAAAAGIDADGATRTDEDDDFYQGVVAALDDHLDRVDHDLDAAAAAAASDAANGNGNGGTAAAGTRGASSAAVPAAAGKRGKVPFHVGTLARPQDSFAVPVDNSDVDFHPPVPYGRVDPAAYRAQPGVHPMRRELEALEYPPFAVAVGDLTLPTPLADSEAIFVDSEVRFTGS